MRVTSVTIRAAAILAILLASSSAMQAQGKGRVSGKARTGVVAGAGGARPEHRSARPTNGAQNSSSSSGPNHRPPGWDKGRKEGWHGGSVPPGRAKKGWAVRPHTPMIPDGRPARRQR